MESRMDTAPRRPTQARNVISRWLKSKGNRQSQTASGRATKMRKRPSTTAGMAIEGKSDGVASSPSITNMMICASQVMPSWNRLIAILD